VSFGTYLLHPVIIAGAVSAGLAGRVWAGPLALAAVIAAAWLAHITIERPALRAADWLRRGRETARPVNKLPLTWLERSNGAAPGNTSAWQWWRR